MGSMQVRGGIPDVWNGTVTSGAVVKHKFPFNTSFVQVGTDHDVKVYFTEADATADQKYVIVTAATANNDVLALPLDLQAIFFKAVSTTATVTVVALQKRG